MTHLDVIVALLALIFLLNLLLGIILMATFQDLAAAQAATAQAIADLAVRAGGIGTNLDTAVAAEQANAAAVAAILP